MKDEELNDVNIQHFKLINGDELIALVRGSEGSRILLEFPLMLNVMPMGSGKESFYFTEWMPMTKDEVIQVYATSIISHSECTDEFKEHYIRTALKFKQTEAPKYNYTEDDIYDDDDEEYDNVIPINTTIH